MVFDRSNKDILYVLLEEIILESFFVMFMIISIINNRRQNKRKRGVTYSMIERLPGQAVNLGRLIGGNQIDCYDNLRMDRNAFSRLCVILKNWGEGGGGGLVDGKHVSVEEQVAMFLSILTHHKKNRVVKFYHQRSGQTVSHYVNVVLLAVLRLHSVLFAKPVPVSDDCTNPRWKWFKKDLTLHGTTHKEWTYFVDWIDVFGKDRATGEAAREVPDVVGEMERQSQPPNINIPQESNDDNDFTGEGQSGVHKNTNQAHGDQEENSASQKAKNTSRSRAVGKKRKSNTEHSEPELTKLFGEFCKSTGERLETIASRIGYDHDLGTARK
ncbi:hypothetical protein ACS0TY_032361 [Phlomoides rotata]